MTRDLQRAFIYRFSTTDSAYESLGSRSQLHMSSWMLANLKKKLETTGRLEKRPDLSFEGVQLLSLSLPDFQSIQVSFQIKAGEFTR